VLTAEHLLHLEGGDALLPTLDFGARLGERVFVALESELEEDAGVIELGALAPPAVERGAELGALALHLLRALVVVPEVGLLDLLVEGR
jgi:hypothetical protein